jgi:hypothetical protein
MLAMLLLQTAVGKSSLAVLLFFVGSRTMMSSSESLMLQSGDLIEAGLNPDWYPLSTVMGWEKSKRTAAVEAEAIPAGGGLPSGGVGSGEVGLIASPLELIMASMGGGDRRLTDMESLQDDIRSSSQDEVRGLFE